MVRVDQVKLRTVLSSSAGLLITFRSSTSAPPIFTLWILTPGSTSIVTLYSDRLRSFRVCLQYKDKTLFHWLTRILVASEHCKRMKLVLSDDVKYKVYLTSIVWSRCILTTQMQSKRCGISVIFQELMTFI